MAPIGEFQQGDTANMKPNLLKHAYATFVAMFITMLSMPAMAQSEGKARIILEAHNVWSDGSGYQMLLDADHNLYGDKIPAEGPIWDDKNPPANLYDGFEYKIPAQADPSTTPKYMVMDGEDYVDIPAGIYDFCIVAPQTDTKIWIAGDADGPTRGNDYNFEAGKTYRFTMHIVTEVNNDGAKLVITEGGKVTTYDLWVGGTQVTSENCNDLPHSKGTVFYDPSTKTLNLYDAYINIYGADEAIRTNMDGLTIHAEGTNMLASTDGAAIKTDNAKVTITGGGALTLTGKKFGLHAANKSSLLLDNCTISCEGTFGNDANDAAISIKHATVMAKGNKLASVCGIQSLDLGSASISQPAGAYFDATLGGIALNGQLVNDKVIIKAKDIVYYDLEVGSRKVTSANCDDLSKLDNVSGKASYDPETKVLTFENADISGTINAIVSHIDGLTIKLIGNNSFVTEYVPISITKPLTITGGGSLKVKSTRDCAIYANQTDLHIENCTVYAESPVYGIAGDGGTNEHLSIKNANVTAIGTEYASIADLASLTLTDCVLVQPSGAAFDPVKHCVALNGTPVKSKVVITNDPNGIVSPSADVPTAAQGVYTLSGVRLSAEPKDLPKGIYIVNGKKVVKP